MKLSITSDNLKVATTRLSKVVNPKAITSILQTTKVTFDNNKATFVGTDTETTLTTSVDCMYDGEPFTVCLMLEDLSGLAGKAPSGVPIEMDIQPDAPFGVAIRVGRAAFNFKGENPKLFPEPINSADFIAYHADRNLMTEFAWAAQFCASSKVEPFFNGVAMVIEKGKLRICSTDKNALYESAAYEVESSDMKHRLIIPKSTASSLSMFKGGAPVVVRVHPSIDINASFEQDDVTIACRLIDYKFPPYEPILNQQPKGSVTVEMSEFVNAVRLAGIALGSGTEKNTIEVSFQGTQVHMKCMNHEHGKEATSTCECINDGDGDISARFNQDYLLRCLNGLSGSCRITHQASNRHQFVMQEADGGPRYLIMPQNG